jgi:hypothetical protein
VPSDDLPVEALGLDAFETGLLAILRHLCASFVEPGGHGWRRALAIAAERWQPGEGCLILRDLLPVLDALEGLGRESFRTMDPLSLTCRSLATPDEAALMRLLAAMRRDLTAAARVEVRRLAQGWMEPALIVAALTFASRHRDDLKTPPSRDEARPVRTLHGGAPAWPRPRPLFSASCAWRIIWPCTAAASAAFAPREVRSAASRARPGSFKPDGADIRPARPPSSAAVSGNRAPGYRHRRTGPFSRLSEYAGSPRR